MNLQLSISPRLRRQGNLLDQIIKMKIIAIVLIIFGLMSCSNANENSKSIGISEDNKELQGLYNEDQSDRRTEKIDWSVVSINDSTREHRVLELLDSNQVRTAKDFSNAAMIFQHGNDSIAYGMAVKMMSQAIALDSTISKWLLAAAIDRELMSRDEPQIYGTQYRSMNGGRYVLYDIDTTQISDDERREYGVRTLDEQRDRVKLMNKRRLSELLEDSLTVSEIVEIAKQEDKDKSEFDLSEDGINNYGYQLMAQERYSDALEIFKLNLYLYPESFNTFDSYGECLLVMGKQDSAVKAYEKSLELNPNNDHAKRVLSEIKR